MIAARCRVLTMLGALFLLPALAAFLLKPHPAKNGA